MKGLKKIKCLLNFGKDQSLYSHTVPAINAPHLTAESCVLDLWRSVNSDITLVCLAVSNVLTLTPSHFYPSPLWCVQYLDILTQSRPSLSRSLHVPFPPLSLHFSPFLRVVFLPRPPDSTFPSRLLGVRVCIHFLWEPDMG